MENQMMNDMKTILNKNGETFGFSSEDYQTFVTAYSELSYAMAHNDYNMVSLFSLVREQIGKQSFYKLLTDGLRLTPTEISDLNRKLAAFQQIPDQIIWHTIGYRGIQKIVSMPIDNRNRLMQDISDRGDNLTLKEFYSLYGKYSKKSEKKLSEKSDKRDWKNIDSKKLSDRSLDSADRISLTRSDLERIVRQSVESVMSPSMKGKRGGKRGKRGGKNQKQGSKMSGFSFQPMTV